MKYKIRKSWLLHTREAEGGGRAAGRLCGDDEVEEIYYGAEENNTRVYHGAAA